jgi:hypothetical protein
LSVPVGQWVFPPLVNVSTQVVAVVGAVGVTTT